MPEWVVFDTVSWDTDWIMRTIFFDSSTGRMSEPIEIAFQCQQRPEKSSWASSPRRSSSKVSSCCAERMINFKGKSKEEALLVNEKN